MHKRSGFHQKNEVSNINEYQALVNGFKDTEKRACLGSLWLLLILQCIPRLDNTVGDTDVKVPVS